MNNMTLDILHRVYQGSLAKSNNILEIVENYYQDLLETQIPVEDIPLIDDFIDGLRGCLQYRRKTFLITNTVTHINIALMYIIIWLNSSQGKIMDIKLLARRKALESDLLKILKKSLKNHYLQSNCSSDPEVSSVNIRDRFGLLCIILNDTKEVSLQYIYEVFNIILGILCGKNRQMKIDFINWLNTSNIPPLDKAMVLRVLSIPFAVDHVKDFIKDQKANGYQTLQFTLTIQMYSDTLPGCQMEIQIRDQEMHENAVSGSASHDSYKKEFESPEFNGIDIEKLIKVFTVDDFSKLHINGFTSYAHPTPSSDNDFLEFSNSIDYDGIHHPKVFFNRRIAPSLVVL